MLYVNILALFWKTDEPKETFLVFKTLWQQRNKWLMWKPGVWDCLLSFFRQRPVNLWQLVTSDICWKPPGQDVVPPKERFLMLNWAGMLWCNNRVHWSWDYSLELSEGNFLGITEKGDLVSLKHWHKVPFLCVDFKLLLKALTSRC